METTGSKVPLLKQRKPLDVESGGLEPSANPANDVSANPKVPKSSPMSPPSPTSSSFDAEFNRMTKDHCGIIIMGIVLPALLSIWLYLTSMVELSHYHPSKHWPEPIASTAGLCLNATKNSKSPNGFASCENVFYVQISTLLFCACGLLNSAAWVGMWEIACKIRGGRTGHPYDVVYSFSTFIFICVCVIGAVASFVLSFIYVGVGYGEMRCDEDGGAGCVFGYHPAMFDIIKWLIMESIVVAVAVVLVLNPLFNQSETVIQYRVIARD